MIVSELIAALKRVDPNRLVVLSADEEGNQFRTLASLSLCAYRDGRVGLERLTKKDIAIGYSVRDVLKGAEKALCLWP
jgi:hypothetical protein